MVLADTSSGLLISAKDTLVWQHSLPTAWY
jgi:hypothetical protein